MSDELVARHPRGSRFPIDHAKLVLAVASASNPRASSSRAEADVPRAPGSGSSRSRVVERPKARAALVSRHVPTL